MIDKEKVLKGLQCCRSPYEDVCDACPYNYDGDGGENLCLRDKLIPDVIALLKEKDEQQVTKSISPFTGLPTLSCPRCGRVLNQYLYGRGYEGEIKYCPRRGQAVKWE